ncbi:alpha-amylase family glycosyl hydrolase [Gallaecimonas kandeliae]|uniref:alpha-amylase family glycosyl hydrolase n=1 Tax=Gallaecimonas kandeliae TaxID=3029055 RepID=UPI002647D88A|nr:alpha-amylase family glycosyl hydrolase [Gallaecimonas kandeliae]WKE65199.1 alpha-amylase family glycosyl hydrolase [Gallaecimonas kandeliae]
MRLAPLVLALLAGGVQAVDYYGTSEPFAKNAIYFVMTDRFVDGDPGNDHRHQGGKHPTFDIQVPGPNGESANIGYLGGDFKGILNNAGYIAGMGFGAVWITPIVDNPDEAFTGGSPVTWGSAFTDKGKTGYHGYWGDNFYQVDEHLESPDLSFAQFTKAMRAKGLKTVLDIVVNHGSPAYDMPVKQPKFGQIFGPDGKLIADHHNLPPAKLDPKDPLTAFFHNKAEMVQLSNINEDKPAVLDYFVGAYEKWIGEGADAFRIDTIKWVSTAFWKKFSDRIRARHPGFFMFGEAYDYDPKGIAPYSWPQNGAISVLDFPLKAALDKVFAKGKGFETLAPELFLKSGPYQNPYELTTFYDNHDMPRMDATDNGFIDANNWLFTARGIPVIYQGSEVGFMRGRGEHAGNRNYFGQARIDGAPKSPIYQHLKAIAQLRKANVALQQGLMLPIRLQGDEAQFLRVYQKGAVHQQALVLLNKGDQPLEAKVGQYLQAGAWRDALSGEVVDIQGELQAQVPAHGVRVLLLDAPVRDQALAKALDELMARPVLHPSGG